MGELEQLERLQRLRENGALTDDEFERQKAKVLSGKEPVRARAWILVVLGLASIAVVVLFLTLSPRADAEPDQSTTETHSPSVEAGPVQPADVNIANIDPDDPVAEAALSVKRADYAWATSSRIIGMNPAFLETKLGPPPEKTADQMFYEVDGCRVWYQVSKTEITSFITNISEKCEPSIWDKKLAFGTPMKQVGGGVLYADCLADCSNAYDPEVHLLQKGSRAALYIDVKYSSFDYDLEARSAWAQSVRRARGLGDTDIADDDIFRCVSNAPYPVEQAILKAPVTSVWVGREIKPC